MFKTGKALLLTIGLLFTCCTWSQHVNKKIFDKTAEDYKNRIEANCYINFDSVYVLCRKLILFAGDNDDVLWPLYAVSNICWNAEWANEPAIFKEYLKTGEELLKTNNSRIIADDTSGLFRSMVLATIATHLFNLGNFDGAMERFAEIINYGGKPLTSDSSMLRSSCYFTGQALINLGRLDKAMQYFDMGTRYIMKQEEDRNYLWALYYMYYAEYLFSINENEKAREFLKKSIDVLNKDPRKEFTRNSLKSHYQLMTDYYKRRKDIDSAVLIMNKALRLYRKNDMDYVSVYKYYGDIYFSCGLLDSALHYYNKSLALSGVQEISHQYASSARAGIANVLREKKQFEEAGKLYDESLLPLVSGNKQLISRINLENSSGILRPMETMEVLTDKAHLYYDWALFDSCAEFLDTSVALLENALFLNDLSRRELVNFETKAARAESRSDITALGIKASVKAYKLTGRQKYLEKIFAFIEESKGNIILDKFDETRARRHAGIPDALLDTLFTIKNELTAISNNLLMQDQNSKNTDALRRKYYDCFLAYNNKIALIEKKYPRYYKLKYAPENISLREIQKLLPPLTMMIQYSMGEKDIFITGITRTNVSVTVAAKNRKLINSLDLLLHQLSNPDISEISLDPNVFNEFTGASSFVYDQILKPVLEKSGKTVNNLIIIPDGELCYLPFEVLITGKYEGKGIHYEALPYLIKKYTLCYDYSASLWKSNNSRYKTHVAFLGFAPKQDASLQQLTGGINEVQACSHMWRGKCFTGDDATEANFKNASLEGSIIQLATHTLLDDREPQKSCFEFAAGNDSINDGRLYTYELYNMNIPARLAILSSCETGIGHIRRGEGIIGLARAFKYAGCPNIIMSLWKVNDLTTGKIMILFNLNLKRGMPVDLALQKAKLSYLNNNENLHPAYWGSFVLIGNRSPVKNNHNAYVFAVLAIFVLFDFFFILKVTRRKI
jgi:tetratricopeptide (TPR) repeat protein